VTPRSGLRENNPVAAIAKQPVRTREFQMHNFIMLAGSMCCVLGGMLLTTRYFILGYVMSVIGATAVILL
jgi:hypothetical protein